MILRVLAAGALIALAISAAPAAAAEGCASRDRTSNCFEPRGNDAISVQPNRRLLQPPAINPRVASPRLRRIAPPGRAQRQPNLLRWNKRGPDGRIITRRCIGLSCGPFVRQP